MPLRLVASVFLVCSAAILAGCHRHEPKPGATKAEFERLRAAVQKKLEEREVRAKASASTVRVPASAAAEGPSADDDAPSRAPVAPLVERDAPWIADAVVELTSPAQASATSRGVVLNTRDGDVVVAHLGRPPQGDAPGKTPLSPLATAGAFALGRGPSVTDDFVYWISHGTLVRRALPARGAIGPLEVLARDAFDGTRVAVPVPVAGKSLAAIPDTVAYVVRPDKDDGPLVAKLWVKGQEPELLTAEGNSTHSVALVHTEDGVLAVSVQARMAMTPVHARRIHFDAGKPELGDDTVVWVGGGIQPLTEMTVLPTTGTGLVGLIPHERSMKEFGIARLDIGLEPTMDTPTTWMLYPNGIDPAPVAAARVCGEPVFLYAAPETPAPDSEQELVLRALGDSSGKRSMRLASGRAFYFTSLAEAAGGALAVWVTASATFACTVRCPKRRN